MQCALVLHACSIQGMPCMIAASTGHVRDVNRPNICVTLVWCPERGKYFFESGTLAIRLAVPHAPGLPFRFAVLNSAILKGMLMAATEAWQ